MWSPSFRSEFLKGIVNMAKNGQINVKTLCETARRIKAEGKPMDDLVSCFTALAVGSEGFKKIKQNITQQLTNTRKALRERLMKERGLSEDDAAKQVATIVPSFREGRVTARKGDLDDLFGELLAEMPEDTEDDIMEDVESETADVESEVTA